MPAVLRVKLLSPEFRVQTQKKPRLQGHYSPALLYQPPQKWVSVLRFHAFSLLIALYKIPLPWEGHCRTKMKAELILADWVFLQQKKRKLFPCEPHCTVIPYTIKSSDMLFFPLGCLLFTAYLHGCFVGIVAFRPWTSRACSDFRYFLLASAVEKKKEMFQHVI